MNELKKEFAVESGHWYMPDGSPMYTIRVGDKPERPTTLRDARRLGLFPSVTMIISLLSKPGLEKWKLRQAILAALTLPMNPDETLDDFAVRVTRDAKEQSRKRAEEGSAIHGSIDRALQHKDFNPAHEKFVTAVLEELKKLGDGWHSERSFASPLGYGGKVDLHNDKMVIDFKTKEFSETSDNLTWPEQCMQLAAYRAGLGMPLDARGINIFISVNNPGLTRVHEWDQSLLDTGFEKFRLLLAYWQLDKKYLEKT